MKAKGKKQSLPPGYPLAHREGISIFFGILTAIGAACPKCCHGTRVTSKRWAKCIKCGERVERRDAKNIRIVRKEAK